MNLLQQLNYQIITQHNQIESTMKNSIPATKTKPISKPSKTKDATLTKTSQQAHKSRVSNSDARFKSSQFDPKFQPVKANLGKVKIDKRFAQKMKGNQFKIGTSVDRYGRTNVPHKQQQLGSMDDYYYTYQDDPQNNNNHNHDNNGQLDARVPNKKKDKKKKNNKQNKKMPQVEKLQQDQHQQMEDQLDEEDQNDNEENRISKWMEQYNEESSSDINDQELDQQVQDQDSVWSEDKNVIKNQNVQATRRLALCNYDWMNIGAKDLMILFSSFKPTSGTILSVSVYYSQFGKEKMKIQQQHGPQGIWNDKQEEQQNQQKEKKKKYRLNQVSKQRKQQQAFNLKKLRAYEKQRLKYCYAVIQCNSKKTADQIYKQCDGNQFENSNIQFDLRFIPDQLEFNKQMLKQKCDEIPISGEVRNFISRAMGHSKVTLTWEDPELNNTASLKKKNWNKMTDKQIENIDWGLYINQNEEQAHDNFNKIINKNKQKKAVDEKADMADQKKQVNDWRSQCNKKLRKREDQDLEITFPSGFDKQIPVKQEKQSLNKQLKTRKQRWRQAEQQRKKKRQQMQLLVEKDDKRQFKYNPEDQRFKAVVNNPLYYIDPSNPKFDHRKVGTAFQQVVKHNKKKNLQ